MCLLLHESRHCACIGGGQYESYCCFQCACFQSCQAGSCSSSCFNPNCKDDKWLVRCSHSSQLRNQHYLPITSFCLLTARVDGLYRMLHDGTNFGTGSHTHVSGHGHGPGYMQNVQFSCCMHMGRTKDTCTSTGCSSIHVHGRRQVGGAATRCILLHCVSAAMYGMCCSL